MALNIRQFQRDSSGHLDLGFVLHIMLPVSKVVSAVLIRVAFNVELAKKFWKWVGENMTHAARQLETKRQKAWPRRPAQAGDGQAGEAKVLEVQQPEPPATCTDPSGASDKPR
ncbi:uncharacterized protein THITE_154508 [Thermothielavioides terrestris NRRL 8126]|uniref:Uncharacterized protein n=1 Tax=Thermothielavioides terrestris (strain ATCC 38088 / NRRL 8126) TaxID=578455 RepID=G2QVP1_THETT|nr:uncharacterized protein THITE_154508 [Thermothielavioides terrestris NRRL 8126]AEO63022.1 hypothetical protein THITE_154508 [Thermothielavioides terrestris NRRL 8126]